MPQRTALYIHPVTGHAVLRTLRPRETPADTLDHAAQSYALTLVTTRQTLYDAMQDAPMSPDLMSDLQLAFAVSVIARQRTPDAWEVDALAEAAKRFAVAAFSTQEATV